MKNSTELVKMIFSLTNLNYIKYKYITLKRTSQMEML